MNGNMMALWKLASTVNEYGGLKINKKKITNI